VPDDPAGRHAPVARDAGAAFAATARRGMTADRTARLWRRRQSGPKRPRVSPLNPGRGVDHLRVLSAWGRTSGPRGRWDRSAPPGRDGGGSMVLARLSPPHPAGGPDDGPAEARRSRSMPPWRSGRAGAASGGRRRSATAAEQARGVSRGAASAVNSGRRARRNRG
jgi:hypothetical protein